MNDLLSSVHERRDQILVTTRRGRWHSTDMNVERTKKQISWLTFLKSGACSSCFLSFNFSQFKHYPNDIQQTSAKNLPDYVRRALSLNIFSQCWMRSIWLPELSVIVTFVHNSVKLHFLLGLLIFVYFYFYIFIHFYFYLISFYFIYLFILHLDMYWI